MCLAVLMALAFFSSMALAKVSFEETGGEPPYGVYGDPNAQGTKLTGAMFISYDNYRFDEDTFKADGATVLLRLERQKSAYENNLFYAKIVAELDFGQPEAILSYFANELAPQVLACFFGAPGAASDPEDCLTWVYDESLEIKIKSTDNFGTIDVPAAVNQTVYVLVDVELAVKSGD